MEKSFPLDELIDLEELQSIQDSFARAVGISSVIFSAEDEPLTRFTNPTRFCSLIQSTKKGKERCFRSFMEMGKNALESEKPKIFYCFAHGGHFVAPIMIDGEHKGTMFAGQFIPEKFSAEQLHDLEKIAPEIDLDPGLLAKEAGKMRVVGEDVIRNYSSLLFKIVETIARRGAQAAELSRVNDALQRAHDGLEKRVQERTAELAKANKGLEHEITERKLAEEALKDRVEFEKIVSSISTSFINLAPDEIDIGIEDALRSIGEFSGVDRSYLFRLFDDGTKTDNTHEWCAEGIVPQIENLKGLSVADFPWFLGRLNRFEPVHIPSVANLPPEADAEKEILQLQGIRSAILVPMVHGETLVGFIGFDSVRRKKSWSEDNIALLRIVVEIFVNALERKRVMDAIKDSEEKYRNIYNNTQVGLYRSRLSDGKMLMVNNRMAEMFGYDGAEETLADYAASKHYVDPTARGKLLNLLREHGKFTNFEALITKRDGSESWIQYSGTLVPEKGYFEGVATDITRRKAAEVAIRESEEKYRTIYDSSTDAIMMLTPEEGFLSGNPAAVEIFGCKSEKEIISRTPHDLSPLYQPDGALSSEKAEQMMTIVMEKGSHLFEWTHKRMDGKEFPTTVLLTRMELQGRRLLQATIRDITEQKAAEEELKKRAGELEAFNKLAVGREFKMIELKKEINALLEKLGKEPGYKIVGDV